MRAAIFTVSFVLSASLAAQSFAELRRGFFPPTWVASIMMATADYDLDGDVDALVVSSNAITPAVDLLRNDGEGRFELVPTGVALGSINVRSQAVFDADGDVDFDLALTVDSTSTACQAGLLLVRNLGAGNFAGQPLATVNGLCRRLTAADLDGDGDRDLVLAFRSGGFCSAQPPRVWFNDGAGAFTDVTATVLPVPPTPPATGFAALDLTGDSRLDLVCDGNPVQVFVQQANGTFVATAGLIPHALTEPVAIDLDSDGDLDLLGTAAGIVRVLRADPSGWTVVSINQPGVELIRTGDIDGDGDHDLWLAVGFLGSVGTLWRNDGASFTDVSATLLTERVGGFAGEFADTDGDGDLDFLHFSRSVLHNDGTGRLLRLEPWTDSDPTRGATLDFDGDGRLDTISATSAEIELRRNRDGAYFDKPVLLGPIAPDFVLPVTFDIDGDGDRDFVNGKVVLRNDGNGSFVNISSTALPAAWNPPSLPSQRPLRVLRNGDVDGDGDQDLLLGYGTGQTRDVVLINTGFGIFVDGGHARLIDSNTTEDLALFDADGDGDLDLAMATTVATVRLFRNDGLGTFTDVTGATLPGGASGRQVVAGDLDGDGRSDLVLAGGTAVVALRQNGASFVPFASPLPALPVNAWPALADFDVDGDLDLRLSGWWLQNDGTGGFVVPAGQTPYWNVAMEGMGLEDLDGDGDPDEFKARNLHRQLENSLPPRVGLYGELEMAAARVDPTFAPMVFLFLAPNAAAQATPLPPFGNLWLDPATAFARSTHVVPLGQPSTTLRYLCPALPSLIGTTLWAQAFVMNAPATSQWHFSNSVALSVRL